MSAISGVFYTDQRTVNSHSIAALANASRIAGPHDQGYLNPAPGLILQANLLRFDGRSAVERQPHVFARESVITWDGRLDNREDLLIQLDQILGSERSDVAIAGAAYERWGLDSLSKLVGDWSLALWDATTQRLVLARDYMGNRPLYYLERQEIFAWATCLDALVDAFHLAAEPSEKYIAARFLDNVPQEMTPFNDVHLLMAGHHIIVNRRETAKPRRYWSLAPATISFRRAEDCADRLRELLTEAVRVRLRTSAPVWAHLSGGWDSSSVVCLAHRLIKNAAVEAPALKSLTLAWIGFRECDETPHIKAVERWCGLHTCYSDGFDGFCSTEDVLRGQRMPRGWIPKDWEHPVTDAGGRILLTGLMGDVLLAAPKYAPLNLFDDLFRGHALHFIRRCADRAHHRHVSIFTMLKRFSVHAFRRRRVRRTVRQTPGVSPALLALAAEPVPVTFPPPTTSSRATRFLETRIYEEAHDGYMMSSDARPELWWTHPFTHRPLVEFLVAAPPALLWDFSGPRPSMHRSLIDVLPPEILARASKGNAGAAWRRSARRVLEELATVEKTLGAPSQWHIVKRGYVDCAYLRSALAIPETAVEFLKTSIILEVWLTTMAAIASRDDASRRADAPEELPVGTSIR